MKTTENISLAGYSFVIETDAYAELETYLNSIRNCFSGDASAEEIVADIEERIAELLREKYISGMVVDISMIREIRKRIGDPKDMAADDAEPEFESAGSSPASDASAQKAEKRSWKNRRLYRNMDERVLGGVCSGLGTYFGIDKVILRIFFLLFLFIGFVAGFDDGEFIIGLFPILYVCLWIAMPAARTDEQKREMKGKPINLDNYRAKDFNFEKEVREVAESPAGKTFKRAGGIFLGILLLMIGLSGLLGSILIPTVPTILGHEIADEIAYWGALDPDEQIVADIVTNSTFWLLVIVNLGLFCIGVIYGGVMLLFDLKKPSWHPGLVIFIAWLISFFVIAGWVVKTTADILPQIII